MMKRIIIILGISFLTSLLVLGCAGGDDSDDGVAANLQGTWLGWIEDKTGTIEEFSLEIDGDGNVIESRIGSSHYGTGHINEGYDENVFHVIYSAGGNPIAHGIMIVDDQYSYATYGDYGSISTDFMLGVLEKGAEEDPAYASSDIVGSYTVGGAFTGESGVWEGEPISMTVHPDLTFSGDAPEGSFSGDFSEAYDPTYGRYEGTLDRTTTMDITAYISPDGNAVAAFAVDNSIVPDELEDFMLLGLTK